jgi:alpha-beta hydrolase superfamily lysophospholipase
MSASLALDVEREIGDSARVSPVSHPHPLCRMRATPVERQITLRDGVRLAVRIWTGPEVSRGTIVIAHGLGEHTGRYEQLAGELVAERWEVHAADHRGHGRSPGERGTIPAVETIRDDIIEMLHYARATAQAPVALLGHSMGGAFAAWAVAHDPQAADALILSSPALIANLSGVRRLLLNTMLRLSPDSAMGNGLDARFLSHDQAVVDAYLADPLVHDRVSARLASAIITAGQIARAHAPQWTVPTLLLYAGADTLVDPAGSQQFAAAAPLGVVRSQRFETLYHEIFNETGHDEPVTLLKAWLRERDRLARSA